LPVLKRRPDCEAYLPGQHRAHGAPRGAESAFNSEGELAAGQTNADHRRLNREWKRESGVPDREWFLREITPKLDSLSLAQIAEVTGLSLAACSRFRSGTRVPHPRHWPTFAALLLGWEQVLPLGTP
jgi:hypothetical protein